MKIQISGLSEGIHHYRFMVAPEELELGNEFRSQVEVDVTLDKSATQIVLSSSIHTTAEFTCDRCVSLFQEELAPSYRMFYTFEGAETEQIDPVELQPLLPGQAVIDIADDVRQMLVLAIPLKLLCKESCRGLCPRCGKNLNEGACTCAAEEIDPRWEVLRGLSSSG